MSKLQDWNVRSIKEAPKAASGAGFGPTADDLMAALADMSEEIHRMNRELARLRAAAERAARAKTARRRRRSRPS